jgi:hypothetical protein
MFGKSSLIQMRVKFGKGGYVVTYGGAPEQRRRVELGEDRQPELWREIFEQIAQRRAMRAWAARSPRARTGRCAFARLPGVECVGLDHWSFPRQSLSYEF